MKINKLSFVGLNTGLVLMISSWIRYFIMYPDLDKALIYGCVGILIMAVSYLLDKQIKTNNTLEAVEEWIQDKYSIEREELESKINGGKK